MTDDIGDAAHFRWLIMELRATERRTRRPDRPDHCVTLDPDLCRAAADAIDTLWRLVYTGKDEAASGNGGCLPADRR
jgi:hypothetical protein